ncbi:hypothetical protein LguiA_000933 [Lonicera macranthoides]
MVLGFHGSSMNLVNKDESMEDMEPERSSDRDEVGQCRDLASNIRGGAYSLE